MSADQELSAEQASPVRGVTSIPRTRRHAPGYGRILDGGLSVWPKEAEPSIWNELVFEAANDRTPEAIATQRAAAEQSGKERVVPEAA